MIGSIAPNRPGHHGTVVARTVGTVAISCNVRYLPIFSSILAHQVASMGSFGFLGLVPNLVYDPTWQYVNLCKMVKLSQQGS